MDSFIAILREVRDPRDLNARHDCAALLFTALIATLCGAKSCVAIADFVAANEEDLDEMVGLAHGAPSHDCYSRLFRLLDADELAQTFQAFARALRQELGLGAAKGVVAIDGKRLRHAYERGKSHMPALMISVWDAQTQLSLAARAAPGGGEVKATLAALRSLDLKGCTVTADALHCFPAMTKAIRAKGAHYAIKLKGNNAALHACAERAFAQAQDKLKFHETSEHGHDRFERRRGSIVAAPKDAPALPGLKAFGRIESERRTVRKTSSEVHYVALSFKPSPARMMETIRSHWSVENNLHWPLDVIFHEDDARTRKNQAPYNLSIIRRMALDILKAHPDQRSVSRKMNMAAWKKEFLLELFTHMR